MNLSWFRRTDFFPPWQDSFKQNKTLCIGTKSRNLGDALALTTLPEKLKTKYPHLKITTFARGFNSVVFQNNPAITRVECRPQALYGDDVNFGSGNLIQLKERFFDIDVSEPPRPRIYLSPQEIHHRDLLLQAQLIPGNEGKPLCVIHPWGTTRNQVASIEFWDNLVQRWSKYYRFWQVGLIGHPAVVGCEYYLLTHRSPQEARSLFSILSGAQKFIGVDSGPMHVARAFGIPSLIFLTHLEIDSESIEQKLEKRDQEYYYINNHWKFSVLYRENQHSHPKNLENIDRFLNIGHTF